MLFWTQQDSSPVTLLPYLVVDQERNLVMVREDGLKDRLCHDCSDEDLALLRASMVQWEPLSSPATPVQTTVERWGRIPRAYIECLQDRSLSPAIQRAMYLAQPCEQVLSLDAGHMAMITAPQALAKHLLALA